jgi:glycosyltransferase involved in cell wall biosynthesis
LSHEKGVDQFLDAMAVLRVRGFVGSALVIGDGPDRAALEARAKAHDLTGHVVFLGQRADVGDLYPHLDLVVIPSRSEGMPNVLLEAIRADCPVVATAVGAIPTIIGSTAAALIVPPGNPVLLAEAILRGLAELRSADASEARAAIAAEYSLDRRAQLFRSLYDEVLHHHDGLRLDVVPDAMADA